MSRNLVVEPEAAEELTSATVWYEESGTGLGAALVAEVDESIERLLYLDAVGTPVRGVLSHLDVRRVLLPRFPYSVVFIEHADQLHILAFAHHKRRPGYWRGRI